MNYVINLSSMRSLRSTFPLLLGLLLLSCGGGGGPAYDRFGAYNALGGARRANDFSRSNSGSISILSAVEFPALQGGLLAPPLELPLGRLAFIARSDSGATLALTFRDSVIWNYRFPTGQFAMPTLAADSSGVIYIATSRGLLKAVSPEGKLLWERPAAVAAGGAQLADTAGAITIPSPPLALASGALIGSSSGTLARYDARGNVLWAARRGASLAGPFAADPEIGIVAAVTHNTYELADTLTLIDPANGAARWSAPVEGRIVQGPVIAGNLIVVGTATIDANDRRTPSVAAFTLQGKPAWRAPLLLMPRGIAADAEGNLYLSCSGTAEQAAGGALLSLDATGRRRWGVTFESGLPAPAAVSAQWVYVVSRRDGRTGLFTYSRDGVFHDFISIDTFPDVLALTMVSSYGELVLACLDAPTLLKGTG